MGSGLEEEIWALLSRYLNHYKQPGDILYDKSKTYSKTAH